MSRPTSTTGKDDRRHTETREALRQTLVDMVRQRGIERTTLREVAERLSITRPALYYHFASKQDVLESLFSDVVPELESITELAGRGAHRPAGRAATIERLARDLLAPR